MEDKPTTPGVCYMCNSTVIWYKDKDLGIVFTDDYGEFSFICTDEIIYRHAICKQCIRELSDENVKRVFGIIKREWEYSLVGIATDLQFKHIRMLEIVAYDPNEALLVEMSERANDIWD